MTPAEMKQVLEALEGALPRMGHRMPCMVTRPTNEWPTYGSVSFDNCDCEIKATRAAITLLRTALAAEMKQGTAGVSRNSHEVCAPAGTDGKETQ